MTEPVSPAVLQIEDVPDYHRAHWSRFVCRFGRAGLKLFRWQVVGKVPSERKLIVVLAPHTSNWDFVFGILAILALDIRCFWMGKHTIFRKPFAGFMKALGGIPVFRDNPVGVAEQVADNIRDSDAKLIAITPEGTRKQVSKWKTGFLRIASMANCGILLVSMDYQKRQVLLGEIFYPSGNPDADVERIKQYYRQFVAKNPANF